MFSFVDNINDYIQSIGLAPDTGPFVFAMILTFGVTLLLSILKAPKIITIFMTLLASMIFALIGWFPSYLLFIFGIIFVALFFVLNKNSGAVIDD